MWRWSLKHVRDTLVFGLNEALKCGGDEDAGEDEDEAMPDS